MKKLSFIIAMAFVTFMAMAQNTSLVDQNGTSNNVLLKQIGTTNNATATQLGIQDNATLTQTGGTNTAVTAQFFGKVNNATVFQSNYNNNAELVQGMKADYYASIAGSHPELDFAANYNVGSITQIGGNSNIGELLQLGDGNNGSISTNGSNNEAHVYQGWAGPWWGEPSVAGNNNTATVKQTYNNNWAGIWQDGSSNVATLDQNGYSNMARISQGYNYSDVPGVPTVYPVQSNQANVIQDGNSNFLRLFQLGNNNLFKLKQLGEGNTVGGKDPNNRAEFFQQYGSYNKFTGVYRNNNDLYFDVNANAEQNYGATLDTKSIQTGDYNEIGLQQGNGDIALIKQNGIGNIAVLWQNGGGQDATIMQTGGSNTANVLQQNQ
jgi:hypothetical protein